MLGTALPAAADDFLRPLALVQGEHMSCPKPSMGQLPWEGHSELQPGEGMLYLLLSILLLLLEWISPAYKDTGPLLFNFLVMLLQHQSLIRRGAA